MFGAQSIGEAALAASLYAMAGGGGVISDGIAESFALVDAALAVVRAGVSLSETTALGGLVRAPGMPLADQLGAGLAVDAQFLPTALWTELPREFSIWASVVADDAGWAALEPDATDWTNQ
jgi:hypothetical protein